MTARAKTGPRPSFDAADAIAAALDIGLDTFTLAQVAGRLGVSAPSLYRVFANRDALLDGCLAHVTARLRTPDPELSWQDQVRAFADSCWSLCEETSGLALAIITHPGAHVHVQLVLRDLHSSMMAAGFPGDGARAEFVLDFVAESVLITHMGLSAMRSATASGETGIERTNRVLNEERAGQPAGPRR